MEINNSNHFSHDAYLLSSQQNNAASKNVAPLEQVKNAEQEPDKSDSEASALQEKQSSKKSERSEEAAVTSLFQPINFTRAQRQNATANNTSAAYKLTAHQQQLAHHAERAITTYNKVENTQYGQELVNRIEAMA